MWDKALSPLQALSLRSGQLRERESPSPRSLHHKETEAHPPGRTVSHACLIAHLGWAHTCQHLALWCQTTRRSMAEHRETGKDNRNHCQQCELCRALQCWKSSLSRATSVSWKCKTLGSPLLCRASKMKGKAAVRISALNHLQQSCTSPTASRTTMLLPLHTFKWAQCKEEHFGFKIFSATASVIALSSHPKAAISTATNPHNKHTHTRASPAEVFFVFLFFFFFRGLLFNTGCKKKRNSCQSKPRHCWKRTLHRGEEYFPQGSAYQKVPWMKPIFISTVLTLSANETWDARRK